MNFKVDDIEKDLDMKGVKRQKWAIEPGKLNMKRPTKPYGLGILTLLY